MIALTILILVVMEVSLSFDNAVVNATVLKDMSYRWQRRFLTWGVLVAVFGMRLILPVLIVSFSAHIGIISVVQLVISNPLEYAKYLTSAHKQISSFGGVFLLMVFLKYIFDSDKEVHWIGCIERRLSAFGNIEAVEIIIVLSIILLVPSMSIPAGLLGLLCYVLIDGVMGFCIDGNNPSAIASSKRGLARFLYLEILDASFSLDGVVGAFAITNNIIAIMIGLGVGAAVIRTLTVRLVRGGVLQTFIYLEHGAHYGVGALAALMIASTAFNIPEAITGLSGVAFIGLSLLSSMRHKAT